MATKSPTKVPLSAAASVQAAEPLQTDEIEAPEQDLVQDPGTDVAFNEFRDAIKVGVAGRARFQKIYVRLLNGKKSKDSYNPEVDAPPPDQTVSILPTTPENEGRPGTESFLIVGIVLALDPAKYSTRLSGTGGAKDKTREEERKKRGVLPVEKNVLRALVPVTEYINSGNNKYYVACHSTHGMCSLRTITSDKIFYFSEIWGDIAPDAIIKHRRTALGQACKLHAAKIKTGGQRTQTSVIKASQTASNTLTVTREANDANVILMQYSIWELTKSPAALSALEKTIEKLAPDIAKRPSNEGTIAFFDFDEKLKNSDAENLIKEVRVRYLFLMRFVLAMIFC
jgi:hypothetical protein